MKKLKGRIISIVAAVLALVVVALMVFLRHPAGEIAVTIGETKFTSSFYNCVLIAADSIVSNEIITQKSEAGEKVENIDFEKEVIGGVKYGEYVKQKALTLLKEYAAIEKEVKDKGLDLITDEVEQSLLTSVSQTWQNNGAAYEANGISAGTYRDYLRYEYLYSLYFDYLYDEDGEFKVTEEEYTKTYADNYIVVNVLSAPFPSDNEDKAALKEKFESYVTRINDGEDFEVIYNEQNPKDEDEEEEKEEEKEDEEEKEEWSEPLNIYATHLGSDETNNAYEDFYKKVKDTEFKESAVYEDSSNYYVLQKVDESADLYWINSVKSDIRHMLKDEDYDGKIKELCKGLEPDVSWFATSRFTTKNIK